MAIPIGLPNSDDAEDSYRSLDLLLEQLLITLRQVLMHRRREAAANAPSHTVRHRHVSNEGTPVPVEERTSEQLERTEESTRVSEEVISSLPLPDVVLDASAGVQQEQKETRTVEKSSETTTTTTTTTTTAAAAAAAQTQSWVGADLKRLSDQLLATNKLDQKDEKRTKMKEEKDPSLLSLFCPPLGGSVWTTVALLVGWGLLTRSR